MKSTRSCVFGNVYVELWTTGVVIEKYAFGRASPPCTARVDSPSVLRSFVIRLHRLLDALFDGVAHGIDGRGQVDRQVRVLRRDAVERAAVVAGLEFGELQAVRGGDDDHALLGADGAVLLQLDERGQGHARVRAVEHAA